ncbi:hypothetical protein [Paraburkholderia acidicola]|nr:hypothetical protein [Paraburkholderia acidicola]
MKAQAMPAKVFPIPGELSSSVQTAAPKAIQQSIRKETPAESRASREEHP